MSPRVIGSVNVREGSRSLLIVVAVWAAIYLPALGSLEIKGEEGRRILPAITMLETGNYIVPHVGGEPYFQKPPLVNWIVAASFRISGQRNEWAARLPSALCLLAVALVFITVARRTLGADGSLMAALIWLTSFGMIEKGRLIEIEALYVSLTGLAFIFWLSWWRDRRSPWLTWTVPWIFLGLALLAKGPLHLVFFYAVVVAALWRDRELRLLWSIPHAAGTLIMLGIFAAWAVPYIQALDASQVAHTWSRQFSGRLSGEDFNLAGWLLNIPRGLGYFLPWTILLPLVRFDRLVAGGMCGRAISLAAAIALSFLAISLLPGTLPRYTMPLLVPTTWLLAILLRENAILWPRRPLRAVLWTAATVSLAMIIYATAITPILQRRQKVKTIAEQINAQVPSSSAIYAVDPTFQPWLFYVRRKLIYVSDIADVAVDARYLLIQPEKENEVAQTNRWRPLRARPILRIKDYRNREAILLKVQDSMEGGALRR